MKTLSVFCAVILSVYAAPEGYYKQEYQFKKSSATYKNNQLETKNDDEGYYGKQGDLSGHIAPQVEQHNQHSEFISPSVDNVGHSLTTYNDRDLTSEAESAFRNHNILPHTNRQYSQSSSSSSFDRAYTPTYAIKSNLAQITRNLQYDMEQQVRDALRSRQSGFSHGTHMSGDDMQYLENQLRNNITRQLQQSLYNQYGQQMTRGQSSYSTTASGDYQPTANYDINELNYLKQQMENSLLKKLHEGAKSYFQSTSSSSSSSWNTYGSSSNTGYNRDEVDDLNQRQVPISSNHYPAVDNTQIPERMSYGQNPIPRSQSLYSSGYGQSVSSGSRYYQDYDKDFPTLSQSHITVNPTKRISDVMQAVQNDLTKQVRNALSTYQSKYSGSTYTLTNSRPDTETALNDLRRQLRYNLTRMVEDELDRTYGRQDIRGEYSFSQHQRSNANYKIADLNDLKQQIENNLINYLETSFRSYEKHYQQSRQQYTNAQRDYSRYGPHSTQSLTSDIAQNPNHVAYLPNQRSWSSSSSWSAQSSYGSDTQQPLNTQLEEIRAQLQQDLNKQLQAAVHEYKSHSSYSTQSSDQMEQLLSNELKSNLTRRLQETLNEHYGKQGTRGGQSYTISLSGVYNANPNYRTEDLNKVRQQLQDDLERNLREHLRGASTSQYSTYGGNFDSGYSSGYSAGPTQYDEQVADYMGQHTIDDTHGIFRQDEGLVQEPMNYDIANFQLESQMGPARGDIGQKPQKATSSSGYTGQVQDLEQKYEDLDEITQHTEDHTTGYFKFASNSNNHDQVETDNQWMQIQELKTYDSNYDFPRQIADDDFEQIELGSSRNCSYLQGGSQRKPQSTKKSGQQIHHVVEQKSNENIERQPNDNFGQIELESNPQGHQEGRDLEQRTEDNHSMNFFPVVTSQQEYIDNADDMLTILRVKPLEKPTSTTRKPTTTHAIGSIYHNRYYQNRNKFENDQTTTTLENSTIFDKQVQINNITHQITESQESNHFIDHVDYSQHIPQITQQTIYPTRNLNHYRNKPKQSSPDTFQDIQEQVEDDDMQQRDRPYKTYTSPGQGLNEHTENMDITKPSPDVIYSSSEGIEEEEAVTEVIKPLGFWQKLGGKITKGYNSVKQKAKDLVHG